MEITPPSSFATLAPITEGTPQTEVDTERGPTTTTIVPEVIPAHRAPIGMIMCQGHLFRPYAEIGMH